MSFSWHQEPHFSQRNNWLRAGVLGANDGLISIASLLFGLAAAKPDPQTVMITGFAALVAGALSMAAGEYVSVSSQADTEKADLHKEQHELTHNPEQELAELCQIYQDRGLSHELARQVAEQLTQQNALQAHARDEIGITEISQANPLQAAFASAISFCVGALLPVLVTLLSANSAVMLNLAISTLIGLALLGYCSAKLGGAPVLPAICRILIWGVLSLGITSLIGFYFGLSA
ncbi:VIT1/CCC1 transporter family protein [Testudinibacter sp. TR-2022]|uniref:VIT1/CCC1 transporter family protein n=1 Tax=Testudinibacter sp. TR-2022 TaxID=2585029 RepID=UPI0011188EA0|nr:VIT family protein [Testudinibacter sp. TR-2022]TNH06124.1 VIT family protein [Pasteurellaceae bacterium Phil11]TNH21454.1 VIT family protein [Testudinibacter sp. TR-2022]TNH25381.1 VIT family protein [Testudinibacter sp. TR-2022]